MSSESEEKLIPLLKVVQTAWADLYVKVARAIALAAESINIAGRLRILVNSTTAWEKQLVARLCGKKKVVSSVGSLATGRVFMYHDPCSRGSQRLLKIRLQLRFIVRLQSILQRVVYEPVSIFQNTPEFAFFLVTRVGVNIENTDCESSYYSEAVCARDS